MGLLDKLRKPRDEPWQEVSAAMVPGVIETILQAGHKYDESFVDYMSGQPRFYVKPARAKDQQQEIDTLLKIAPREPGQSLMYLHNPFTQQLVITGSYADYVMPKYRKIEADKLVKQLSLEKLSDPRERHDAGEEFQEMLRRDPSLGQDKLVLSAYLRSNPPFYKLSNISPSQLILFIEGIARGNESHDMEFYYSYNPGRRTAYVTGELAEKTAKLQTQPASGRG